MKIKSTTCSALARRYEVHFNTMKGWLKRIPGLHLESGKRKLTPKQHALILKHLDPP